ncbi:MAG: B-box zinc finger protein [Chloroflexota bacterium]|nr:B-box zinc finger protein [Chloroflexota bacterium]
MNEPLYCVNHPKVETYLRCNKCGQPICVRCAVQTPVGYRCRDCINAQQKTFYADFRPVNYLVAAAVALPLSFLAGWLVPSLGWYAIFLGPLAGTGIAEASHWAVRRQRGSHTWLVVCGCIVVGMLPKLLLALLIFSPVAATPWGTGPATGWLMGRLWEVVYLVAAVGSAYARLRPGRRV